MTSGFFFGDDFFKDDDRYDADDRRFFGCCVALVTNNQDPEGMGRVKVRYPWLDDTTESHWARVMQIMTGGGRGWWNIPEVNDEVIVSFEQGDMQFPYIIGHVWNGKDRPPMESMQNTDGKNDIRMYESRSGHRLVFDDGAAAHVRLVDRSGKNYIRLWNPQNKVEIVATDGDQFYKAPAKRILIEAKNLVVNVKDSMTSTAGTDYTVDVKENAVLQSGVNTSFTAGGSLELKADQGYKHQSGAGLTLKSNLLNVFGTEKTSVNTTGDLTFLSLILMKIGVGVFNAKAPIMGIKTLISQMTNSGPRMKVNAKIVTFDGLKIAATMLNNTLKAKQLVLIRAPKVNLNVGGPAKAPEKTTNEAKGGALNGLRSAMAKLKTQLERLSNAIKAAIGKLPKFLQDMVSKFLKNALNDFFKGFLPAWLADPLATLLSGGGLTGVLGDLFGGLEDTDYDAEFAKFSSEEPAKGEEPTFEPEMIPETRA
jgi:phage baseplate assembly protein gpV